MSEKKYVATGKKVTTQFGEILKLSLSEKDVQTLQENLSNGWVNVDILPRREVSPTGKTHYGVINEWKPEPRDGEAAPAPKKAAKKEEAPANAEEVSAEDLPF